MRTETLNGIKTPSCRLEPVWFIHIELGPEDDERIRLALCDEIGLSYGDYDHVAFESATGTQFHRGSEGTASGAMDVATTRPVPVLSFSIAREEALLTGVIDIIDRLHSYEEPVVYVRDAHARRSDPQAPETENKWWVGETE